MANVHRFVTAGMKAASGWRIAQIGDNPGDLLEGLMPTDPGYSVEQTDCIRMLRTPE